MSRGTLRVRGPWGPFSKIEIVGGPWLNKPKEAFGICMAPEVMGSGRPNVPEPDVMVNVKDFSTPDSEEVRLAAMLGLLTALHGKRQVYVGCGFGIGRTGTMLGLMARIANPRLKDPVEYVRENYFRQAVETQAQADMVRKLNVEQSQKTYNRWLWGLRMGAKYGQSITRDDWMDPLTCTID